MQNGNPLLEAHEAVIALVPRIVWLGTKISRRFDDVLSIGDAVHEAAAAAIELENHSLAIEWLEQGRSIIWGQILNLRTPVDDLKLTARHDLALQLEQVSRQLELAASPPPLMPSIDMRQTDYPAENEAQEHRSLAHRYEQLLSEIRQVHGFERFLHRKQLSDLLSASSTGSVVIINVHKNRCDALILRNRVVPVVHVPLTALTLEKATHLHSALNKCLAMAGIREREGRASKQVVKTTGAKTQMQDILATLWECVVHPILSALGYTVSKFKPSVRFAVFLTVFVAESNTIARKAPTCHLVWNRATSLPTPSRCGAILHARPAEGLPIRCIFIHINPNRFGEIQRKFSSLPSTHSRHLPAKYTRV